MSDWKPKMEKSVRRLAEQLKGIRPGTLGAGIVDTIRVRIGGNPIPIGRLATVIGRGDRIVITPFDPAAVPAIVRALVDAKMSAYALDPATVCVGVPPISGEQKAELAKHVKALGEEAKVAVRSIRQEARKRIAARGRGSERAVQEATDAAISEIERLVKGKAAELRG